MKFDFSQFHPLDHRWGSLRCWRLPRGPIRHAVLWWKYQGPGFHLEDWEDVTWQFEEKRNDPRDQEGRNDP